MGADSSLIAWTERTTSGFSLGKTGRGRWAAACLPPAGRAKGQRSGGGSPWRNPRKSTPPPELGEGCTRGRVGLGALPGPPVGATGESQGRDRRERDGDAA